LSAFGENISLSIDSIQFKPFLRALQPSDFAEPWQKKWERRMLLL